jgi:hypothetical protein
MSLKPVSGGGLEAIPLCSSNPPEEVPHCTQSFKIESASDVIFPTIPGVA